MNLIRLALVASVPALFFSVPAKACTIEPFLFQLPGETAEKADSRSDSILSDYAILRRVDRENDAYKKAANIYLGRMIATTHSPTAQNKVAVVHPVAAIRGTAPKDDQKLEDDMRSGMCAPVGDGDITDLPPGSYVVVFNGLPQDTYRPRGIDSFAVDSLRNGDLLEAVMKFGKDLTE